MIIIEKPDASGRSLILLTAPTWPIFRVIGQWDYIDATYTPEPGIKLSHRELEGLTKRVKKLVESKNK